MEFIIKDDILQFMIENELLANLQQEFISRKSCQSNLLTMMNILTIAVVNTFDVDLVYLDFAKVFDSVPHRKLLHKFEKYDVSGNALNCIKTFLSNRRQRVRTDSNRVIKLRNLYQWRSSRQCVWPYS